MPLVEHQVDVFLTWVEGDVNWMDQLGVVIEAVDVDGDVVEFFEAGNVVNRDGKSNR